MNLLFLSILSALLRPAPAPHFEIAPGHIDIIPAVITTEPATDAAVLDSQSWGPRCPN